MEREDLTETQRMSRLWVGFFFTQVRNKFLLVIELVQMR